MASIWTVLFPFFAPLVIGSKTDVRLLQLSRQWIDGVPLDIACKMIPWKARFSPSILMHIILHAFMQNKYADPRSFKDKKDVKKMSMQKLVDIVTSLACAVNKCVLPKQKTEWVDYYNDTNYSNKGAKAKLEIVENVAQKHKGKLAIDLGANTGRFSRPLAPYFETVISADIDPMAVDAHYRFLKQNGPKNILPLVLDLSSPSPSLGWASTERASFANRCSADFLMALALCHHLFFTVGVPFKQISSYFAKLLKKGGILVCEFIPKDDSQVQRMLSSRDDIFDDYTKDSFDQAFKDAGLIETYVFELPGSMRTLHVFSVSLKRTGMQYYGWVSFWAFKCPYCYCFFAILAPTLTIVSINANQFTKQQVKRSLIFVSMVGLILGAGAQLANFFYETGGRSPSSFYK